VAIITPWNFDCHSDLEDGAGARIGQYGRLQTRVTDPLTTALIVEIFDECGLRQVC
jgi:hypothetical protein